jgi:alkylhydroperoxidase family enzyme
MARPMTTPNRPRSTGTRPPADFSTRGGSAGKFAATGSGSGNALTTYTRSRPRRKSTQQASTAQFGSQHEPDGLREEEKINDIGDGKYTSSPYFTEGEKALLDLTVQIGVDANRVPAELWNRLHNHYSEPQIVEAVFTITQHIAISKFGDALGVELEPVFQGLDPILHVEH